MRAGEEQQEAYGGKGLDADEYAVMVIVAKHLEQLTMKAAA